MTNFISISQLQSDHQQEIALLKAQIKKLKVELSQSSEQARDQALIDNEAIYQQRLESALREKAEELESNFSRELEQRVDAELVSRTERLQVNIQAIETEFEQLMLNCFEHCYQLSTAIIKKITSEDSAIKLDIVRKTLLDSIKQQSLSDLQLTVHLNYDDATALEQVWQQHNIIVKVADILAPGDVKITSDVGVLSGLMNERISQIMNTIKNDNGSASK